MFKFQDIPFTKKYWSQDVSYCDLFIFEDLIVFKIFGLFLFRKNKTKRVTRVELNKRARRKERLRAEAEAKKMENISKEIDR